MARESFPLSETLALTGIAQTLPPPSAVASPQFYVFSLLVQCPSTNSASVLIGSVGAANIELSPGDSITLKGPALDNGTQGWLDPELFEVLGSNGDVLELLYNPDAELRKGSSAVVIPNPLPVSGTVTANQGTAGATPWPVDTGLVQSLTDAQLRAAPVDVDTGLVQGLTDAQLRAAPVDVDTGLVQGLTDAQLRATPVPVSGTLTDAELRATPVPVTSTPAVPAALTVKQAAITVGTSAVRLTTDGAAPSATRRKLQYMPDPDSVTTAKFWVGSSSVTATGGTRGTQVFAGQLIEETDDANDYYMISDTAGQTILVLEVE